MSDQLLTTSFDPKHQYQPFPDVTIDLFPPRLMDGTGMSTTEKQGVAGAFTWTAVLDTLTLDCAMTREGSRWEIRMTLRNSGPDREVTVRYPVVHYLFPDGMPLRHYDQVFGGVLEQRDLWIERFYPGDGSVCAGFVCSDQHALGLAVRNGEQLSARLWHLPAHTFGNISIELERVMVRQGETVELPSAYIGEGRTWGDVLRLYRTWLLGLYPERPQPLSDWYWNENYAVAYEWAHCIAPNYPPKTISGAWIFDPSLRARTLEEVYADVDAAVETLGRRGLKPLFFQFGWWESMATCQGTYAFDTVCGDYTAHHALTPSIIDYIHQKGGKTYLYTNFISAGEDTDVFRNHPEFFVHDAAGFPVRNAGYPMFLFCPGVPALKDYWDATLRYMLLDLDADGVFLDQVGGGTRCPFCYDPAHDHAHPGVYGQDFITLLDWVCTRAREIKPDCFIACELVSDIRSLWGDQLWDMNFSTPKPMVFSSREEAAQTLPGEHFAALNFVNPHLTHVAADSLHVARGFPGLPDNPVWRQFRHIFRTGPQPCITDPVGGIAYLYGPVNGEAILATLAWADLHNVTVELPLPLQAAGGGTQCAAQLDATHVRVDAGQEPRFYRLELP